jgi:Ca2+-transporting ATPase
MQNNKDQDITIGFHALDTKDVAIKLNIEIDRGLSSDEAAKRLEQYGRNELTAREGTTFLQRVISQLNNFVVILLLIAAVVSALLGDYIEAAVIMAIVVLNTILGVVQESRAEEALAALKKMAAPEANVLRDGRRVNIPAPELVPGDIVFLDAGNFIPADLRLVEAVNMRIDEAALTGESVPVQKNASLRLENDIPIGDRKNTAFMGTMVTYGRGQGIVVGTGMKTQLGMIADMLQSVEEEETPLQKRLDALGRLLGWASLAICGLVFIVIVIRHLTGPGGMENLLETIVDGFMIAVSLAIAAVPEGLPAVVTISLAMGMREMVRRHALIRKLASVETLGSATVICSDKTGTLTQNEMTVTRIWVDGMDFNITGSGYNPVGDFLYKGHKIKMSDYPALAASLWVGVLNNDAYLETIKSDGSEAYRLVGDPTEGSLIVAAAKAGIVHGELIQSYPRQNEVPFDSTRKRMVTIHSTRGAHPADASPIYDEAKKDWYAIVVKGAPDIVLNLCNKYAAIDGSEKPLDDANRRRILEANDAMTKDALRVLGLAYKLVPQAPKSNGSNLDLDDLENDLVFTGMSAMIDPARPEVNPALEKARGAGIRTIMITGDYPNTAAAIARSINLLLPGREVRTGFELDRMSNEQVKDAVKTTDVFARVSPEHKMKIVDALRANDQVVAMTGDGVNDAPAIKRADIGVAMGITGTDVAKETADMVLTDDNYASIVSAIEQGRIIYSNIRKFVYYLISCNIAEIMIIFLSTLFTGNSPLTAIQLLWLNLVTDGAPALALANEVGDPDIMQQQPRPVKESIINRYMQGGIIVQTIAITTAVLLAYFIGLREHPDQPHFAQTMAFVTLSVSELLRAFTSRSEYFSILKIGVFKNKWMNLGVLSSLILIFLVIYVPFLNGIFDTTPLGWAQWKLILPLVFLPSIAAEVKKLFWRPGKQNQ